MTLSEMKAKVIEEANNFYNGRNTNISDAVYDGLLKFILDEDPSFNIYDHVKYDTDGVKISHNIKFRDFEKRADIACIDSEEKFNKMREKYYILPKFDGSSIVTHFNEDGTLKSSASRSDDVTGFVQTNKLRNKIANCSIPEGCLTMLAEAVCPKYGDDGESLNRSKANGLINSKYCQEDVDKYITLMPFDFYMKDGTKMPNLDLEVTDYNVFCKLRDDGEYIYSVNGKLYPCDGIVNYPKDFKDEKIDIHKLYYSEMKDSILRDIIWYPADNSGVMNPTAVYDTVTIDETNVSKASVFNYQFVKDHNMYIGMPLKIIKANLTIPQIHESTWKLPENDCDEAKSKSEAYLDSLRCSCCGSKLRPYGGISVVCDNDGCAWWLKFISYRILDTLGIFTDASYEMVYSDNQFHSEFMKGVMELNKDKIDLRNNIKDIMNVVRIPRYTQKKLDYLYEDFNKELSNNNCSRELINKVVRRNTSDLQWEYFELMYNRVLGLLDILSC